MPQVPLDKRNKAKRKAEATPYSKRQRSSTTRRGSSLKGPKSVQALDRVNEKFLNSIGRMTRNFEMIAASKLLQSGSTLSSSVVKSIASEQKKLENQSAKAADARKKKRKRMKGQRGPVDSDSEDDPWMRVRLQKDEDITGPEDAEKEAAAAAKRASGLNKIRAKKALGKAMKAVDQGHADQNDESSDDASLDDSNDEKSNSEDDGSSDDEPNNNKDVATMAASAFG